MMFRNPLVDAIVVLLIVVLFFAPKRLPGLGKGIGEGIKEFKHGLTGAPDATTQAQLPEGDDAAQTAGAPAERNS